MNNPKSPVPNYVSLSRIIGAFCLLALDVTPHVLTPFWCLYAFCGATDIVDGYVARRLRAETMAGAMLDSCADIIFVVCSAIKLLPLLAVPSWLWIWAGTIAGVKIVNQASALVIHGKFVFPHTCANKLTGLFLFISTPALVCLELIFPLFLVAGLATYAAIQEGCHIREKQNEHR